MTDALFLLGFLVVLGLLSVGIMMSATFQLVGERRERSVRARMRKLRKGRQPWVTVLVYGDGVRNPSSTLRSVLRSHYHAYDVVYVDDSRRKAWQATLPGSDRLRVLARRVESTKSAALQAGYRKSARGEIVMVLDAGERVGPNVLKRAVASREGRSAWNVTLEREYEAGTLQALLQSLMRATILHAPTMRCGIPTALRRIAGRRPLVPAAQHSMSVLLGLVALVAVASVVTLGPRALWYVWVIVTTYGLLMVWLRVRGSVRTRLALSLSVPSALFLLPSYSLVRGISHFAFKK